MKALLALVLALVSFTAFGQGTPCYWSGQLTKCFPTTGLYLDNSRTLRLGTNNVTNYVELKAPSGMSGNVSFTLPSADGTSGQALVTNASGVLSFADKANITLNNLGTTAVNADLLPASDDTKKLGSTALTWDAAYFRTGGVNYLTDTGTNAVQTVAPSGMSGSYTLTWPSNASGNVGYLLTDASGTGTLGWSAPGISSATMYTELDAQETNRPADIACVSNITLSGSQTCDGQSTTFAFSALVMGQTDPTEDGWYFTNAFGAWTRLTGSSGIASIPGQLFCVTASGGGTNYSDTCWIGGGDGSSTATFALLPRAGTATHTNLTASKALVTNASGQLTTATTTATEIGYVSGVTSAIQTQLGTKTTNPMTTTGDIIYASNTATPATAARLAVGGANTVLHGGASVPAYAAVADADLTGQVGVAHGGTGAATLTTNGVVYGNGTSAVGITAQGAANSVLVANAGAPSFSQSPTINNNLTLGVNGTTTGGLILNNGNASGQAVTIQNAGTTSSWSFNLPTGAGTSGQPLLSGGGGVTAQTYGTLGVAAGGTGLTSGTSGGVLGYTASGTLASSAALTANGVVLGGGAGATPTSTAAGTNGQLLIGNTSAAPTWGSSVSAQTTFTSGYRGNAPFVYHFAPSVNPGASPVALADGAVDVSGDNITQAYASSKSTFTFGSAGWYMVILDANIDHVSVAAVYAELNSILSGTATRYITNNGNTVEFIATSGNSDNEHFTAIIMVSATASQTLAIAPTFLVSSGNGTGQLQVDILPL